MLVKDMVAAEHPNYRGTSLGMRSLSNVELITITLRLPRTETADAILAPVDGSLRKLSLSVDRIAPRLLNAKKRESLAGAFELGVRCLVEDREVRPRVGSPKDVIALCAARMEYLLVEEFHALLLDAQHRMIKDVTVTRGVLNATLVSPREVFAPAIVERAAAMILVHNHPSGDPHPSSDDRNITDQLVTAGRVMDIPVHDHVIIGHGRYVSFAESGLL